MKRLQQFILWLADGIWYAVLLLTIPASAQVILSGTVYLSTSDFLQHAGIGNP